MVKHLSGVYDNIIAKSINLSLCTGSNIGIKKYNFESNVLPRLYTIEPIFTWLIFVEGYNILVCSDIG